ncbi:MAG: UDP-N-acetylmuramoyl-L-alanyl-D-glutamate--2,6-diaminopimelate ligase [Rhizomicrobium sp.]|jgi:UDP-N-acetylmuramoyl-L-alanyl-D-glutamate--2,6-diaminopimelate ligase
MEPYSGAIVAKGNVGVRPVSQVNQFAGLACDSREVAPGYLFAALPGTRANGSDFVEDAVRRGAVAVLGVPAVHGVAESLGVQFIADDNPRRRLAYMAAEHFGAQPDTVAAITGTNGKTSVSVFLRQIWSALGYSAASMGTIGVVTPNGEIKLEHTTPDPIVLHRTLARLRGDGVDHLALEASSHGLDQYRLDGVRIAAAAFTNITRDHLDYHPDFAHYLSAKLRLFGELLVDGGIAVINADAEHAEDFARAAQARAAEVLTVGEKGNALRLVSRRTRADGQSLAVRYVERDFGIHLSLAGSFQASNALAAAALAIGLGEDADRVFGTLAGLRGAPGRLQKVACAASGAPIYVDYAHTPDALLTVLDAIRPHVEGRLHVVFGCGGDRDAGKRPLMGRIAAEHADRVIVTDDNPRSENAAGIRAQILAACPCADEIGDRATAISSAIAALEPGDVLVIAGKGHESGQIVGRDVRAFSDTEQAVRAARELGGRAVEAHS